MPPPETPGPSQASLGQSLVGSLLLSLGSWCTQGFVCALQESVSPVLCKFWWLYGGVNGLRSVKVNERLIKCHRLKETKQKQKINAMWDPGMDYTTEKYFSGKIQEN